jgi:hypothetical protein
MHPTEPYTDGGKALADALPGGRDGTSAGLIGCFLTKASGDRDQGQIQAIEIVAVAYEDRAEGAQDSVTLRIYGEDGDLLNEVMQADMSLARTDAGLGQGYDKVQIQTGEGKLPLPEDGTYELTWGGDPVGQFKREALFRQIVPPLEYAVQTYVDPR